MARSATPATRLLTADRVGLGFAGVVIVLASASTDDPSVGMDSRRLDAIAAVLFVAGVVLTFAAPRFPAAVASAVLALTVAWYGFGYTSGLINVAALVAFYRLGESPGQARKVTVAGLSVAIVMVNIALLAGDGWSEALTAAGYIVIAVLFGELMRNRHLLLEQYARRAEQAEVDAERRVAEERLRIARDLHDVLAHAVSAMTVQAAIAADQLDRDPSEARQSLHAIRQAGRQAMAEVKAAVAVLRSGPGGTEVAHLPAEADGNPNQLIRRGETWSPTWTVDQPAATLWYHPHPHGRTSDHVYRASRGCSSSTTTGRSTCLTTTGSMTSPSSSRTSGSTVRQGSTPARPSERHRPARGPDPRQRHVRPAPGDRAGVDPPPRPQRFQWPCLQARLRRRPRLPSRRHRRRSAAGSRGHATRAGVARRTRRDRHARLPGRASGAP